MPDTVTFALEWDKSGERYYENGISRGVLYEKDSSGAYVNGVAWNGLTSVQESPDGAEPNELWADNMKYGVLYSAETFGGTIEAYTYPPEFEKCDGSATLATGVTIGQQTREPFGFCYRTEVGNDTGEAGAGYKLHLVYGATASPSDRDYETINDSPDAITFSWEFTTIPVNVAGHKPTSTIIIDSRTADETKLTALEKILYGTPAGTGTEAVAARMPLPGEIATLMA